MFTEFAAKFFSSSVFYENLRNNSAKYQQQTPRSRPYSQARITTISRTFESRGTGAHGWLPRLRLPARAESGSFRYTDDIVHAVGMHIPVKLTENAFRRPDLGCVDANRGRSRACSQYFSDARFFQSILEKLKQVFCKKYGQ